MTEKNSKLTKALKSQSQVCSSAATPSGGFIPLMKPSYTTRLSKKNAFTLPGL
jgi:hypothetical protein